MVDCLQSFFFFRKIAMITRGLQNRCLLYLYCECNLGRGRQSTLGVGVGEGGTHIMAPNTHIPDTCPLGGLSSSPQVALSI